MDATVYGLDYHINVRLEGEWFRIASFKCDMNRNEYLHTLKTTRSCCEFEPEYEKYTAQICNYVNRGNDDKKRRRCR